MADKHLYKVMFDIELSEDLAGYLDRQFPEIESMGARIGGNDHNEGYLKAVLDGSEFKDESERNDIQILHQIIKDGRNVVLVPTEKQNITIGEGDTKAANLLPFKKRS